MTHARSALSTIAAFVVLALVLGVCMGTWSLTRPAVASPTPDVGYATPSVVPTPSPSPIAPGPDALRIFPMGTIPADNRFFLVGDEGDERVLMLDLGRKTVQQAAHFEGLGVAGPGRQVEIAATGDGSTIVLLEWSDRPNGRLLVLHPSTGALTTFDIPASETPRLTADGTVVAVTRTNDPAQRGLWLIGTADATSTKIVSDTGTRTTSRPISWSGDGKRLAVALDASSPTDPQIAIYFRDTSDLVPVARGRLARWRGTELLYWIEKAGTGVNVYDTVTRATELAFAIAPETVIQSVDPRPGSTDMATAQFGGTRPLQIVLHSGANETILLRDSVFTIAFWFSRDGRHLYAWTDDHGTETVTDLLSNEPILRFCLRAGVAPPCAPR